MEAAVIGKVVGGLLTHVGLALGSRSIEDWHIRVEPGPPWPTVVVVVWVTKDRWVKAPFPLNGKGFEDDKYVNRLIEDTTRRLVESI